MSKSVVVDIPSREFRNISTTIKPVSLSSTRGWLDRSASENRLISNRLFRRALTLSSIRRDRGVGSLRHYPTSIQQLQLIC